MRYLGYMSNKETLDQRTTLHTCYDDPKSVLKPFDKNSPLKLGSVGEPDIYLGIKLELIKFKHGVCG